MNRLARRRFLKEAAAAGLIVTGLPHRFASAQTSPTAVFETKWNGTLEFFGPEMTVLPTGNFNNIRTTFLNTFPANGPGGVLTFAAGQHQIWLGAMAGRGQRFLVRGAAGSKPQIKARTTDGVTRTKFLINSTNVWRPDHYLVMSNLEITDSLEAMETNNLQGQVVENCWIHDNPEVGLQLARPSETPANGSNFSYKRLGWGEILGRGPNGLPLAAHQVMELGMLGSSGTRHNCYLSGQEFWGVSGLFTHSAKHHPFKHVGNRLIVEDSLFYTRWFPNMTDEDIAAYMTNVGPEDEHCSIAHIDMVADSQSIIRRNVFHHHMLRSNQQPAKGRSNSVDAIASRNSSWGNNVPWYGSHEFWEHHADDPNGQPPQLFWDKVAAEGYGNIANPMLYRHFFHDNTLIETGATDGQSTAILLDGTEPAWPATDFRDLTGGCQAAIDATNNQPGNHGTGTAAPKPLRWRERSYVWRARNTITGNMSAEDDLAGPSEGLGIPHIIEQACLPPHPAF